MSVFSLEYFGMLFVTPFLSWIFNNKTRKYLILLANFLFMFLILKNTVSIVYALILAGYTWLSGMILSQKNNRITLFVSLIFPVPLFADLPGDFCHRAAWSLQFSEPSDIPASEIFLSGYIFTLYIMY